MNPLIQFGVSLVAIIALAIFARWLGLGGDVRIRDEAHARTLAQETAIDFEPVAIGLDKAGIGAILKDDAGRQMLLRRHGAHFVGRMLDTSVEAKLDQNFLTLGTGERFFSQITLNLGERAQQWAAGLRYLPHG